MSLHPQSKTACLEAALSHLQGLNGWIADRALRQFQRDIVATGQLAVPDPFTGRLCTAEAVLHAPHNGCLYWFRGQVAPFCVIAASVRLGCPILSLVVDGHAYPVADREQSPLISDALALLERGETPPVLLDPTARPIVCLGHINFAHHVWNEFPGLWHLHAQVGASFDVDNLYDPLGNIAAFCDAQSLALQSSDSVAAMRGWRSVPTVIPGSVYCDNTVKSDLLALLDLPPHWQPADPPRLYVTMRETGRTLENQAHLLARIVSDVMQACPQAQVVCDGFSVPVDFERAVYDGQRSGFAKRIATAQALIADVRACLPQAQQSRLRDITGLDLIESLREITLCRAYLSHTGTMQHKPGWFYPLPGVQHGNTASLLPASLKWTASMMAGAVPPLGVPSALVEDLDVSGNMRANSRNRDYRFSDPDAVIADIVPRLVAMLSPAA